MDPIFLRKELYRQLPTILKDIGKMNMLIYAADDSFGVLFVKNKK